MFKSTNDRRLASAPKVLMSRAIFGMTGMLLPAMASAHDFTAGSSTIVDFVCTNPLAWQAINSVNIVSSPHRHGYVITASADLFNPSGSAAIDQFYHITLSVDAVNPPLDNASARTVELEDNAGVNDQSIVPVSTNVFVNIGANSNHVVRFQCRKSSASQPNLTILDNSLTIVCIQQ